MLHKLAVFTKLLYLKKLINKELLFLFNINIMTNSLNFIDLCCGIGGFHQALTNLDYKCVLASDIDKYCRKNYKENYGIEPLDDLTKINNDDVPDYDILCAGFPCQPFSKAGHQKGFDDDRGNIFLKFVIFL